MTIQTWSHSENNNKHLEVTRFSLILRDVASVSVLD